ncbi:centrosomal protein of 44 kDa [Hoplias malabaricus]|uniref:centrosomal protein of 44 kDa n=1 Tax=Hoplias malabaricus TaxID=27720 RepID=UPI003462AEBE
MATGDVKGALRKLQTSLRFLKYPREVDYSGLAKGDPSSCLPIVSFAFTSFSPAVAEHLVENGMELTGKSDLSFVETVYKVLRDLFSYKPLLTKQQFLQFGFAERKAGLLCDIIGFVLEKHKQLTKGTKFVSPPKRRLLSRSDSKSTESPTHRNTKRTPAQTVYLSRPLVERHLGYSSPQFSLSSDEPPQQKEEEEEEEEEEQREEGKEACVSTSPRPAAHMGGVSESMLRAVEAGLQDCVLRLGQQLTLLDARLQALEKNMSGKITIERSDWENLQSRVLLLETRLTLNTAQDPPRTSEGVIVPHEKRHSTEETVLDPVKGPISISTLVGRPELDSTTPMSLPASSPEESIKERLERIASMMKDTSSLLKNIEPTI